MNQKLFFRTDASASIGLGHFMRCLSLAQEWKKNHGEVFFILSQKDISLTELLYRFGINALYIDACTCFKEEATKIVSLLNEYDEKFVVVDGYQYMSDFFKELCFYGKEVLYIDDMGCLNDYTHLHYILNQNLYAQMSMYSAKNNQTKFFLGPKYVLLRDEFLKWKDFKKVNKDEPNVVLISMGGSDHLNMTLKVVNAFQKSNKPHLKFKVLIGQKNKHLKEIENATQIDCFELINQTDNMSQLLSESDILVSAGGSTCWEAAFMGVPNMCFITAENQVKVVSAVQDASIGLNLGHGKDFNEERFLNHFESIYSNKVLRETMSMNGQLYVDCYGASRICQLIKNRNISIDPRSINLEKAQKKDALEIWSLVNDPYVRRFSYKKKEIPLNEHLKWFEEKISSLDSVTWVLKYLDIIVGVIRYDKDDANSVTMSLFVSSGYRGMGIGSELIDRTHKKIFDELKISKIKAYVFNENIYSKKLFVKKGFEVISDLLKEGIPSVLFELDQKKLLKL